MPEDESLVSEKVGFRSTVERMVRLDNLTMEMAGENKLTPELFRRLVQPVCFKSRKERRLFSEEVAEHCNLRLWREMIKSHNLLDEYGVPREEGCTGLAERIRQLRTRTDG